MVNPFKKVRTKLKTFCQENDVTQWDLWKNDIDTEALKRNEIPLSWSSFSKIVNGRRVPTLEFMKQIRDGLNTYLGRKVMMNEIFDID
jgi:hypothetical protein